MKYEKEKSDVGEYLKTLKKEDGGYKRVCLSPLRYPGGKSKAIGMILENLPLLKEKKIISPFFGGGSFEICLFQKLDYEIIGYDIFELLVNFWNVLKNEKGRFIEELEKFEVTKEEFTYNRHILLNYWDKIKPEDLDYKTKKKVLLKEEDKILLDDDKVLQAVYYYYNMILSYGPMFLGWPSSTEIHQEKFKRRIERLKKFDMKKITISCHSFEEVLEKHRDDFLFLDPPYYLGEDSKMFKGIYPNTNFAIHHNSFNHRRMFELLKEHKGGFFLTYNDCSTIKEWYKEYKLLYPEWQYTYGQGETRIGPTREKEKKDNKKDSHEIFIISYP